MQNPMILAADQVEAAKPLQGWTGDAPPAMAWEFAIARAGAAPLKLWRLEMAIASKGGALVVVEYLADAKAAMERLEIRRPEGYRFVSLTEFVKGRSMQVERKEAA